MKFEEKSQYKKGQYAEEVVDEYLKSKGFVIYKPQGGCAHAFDRLAIMDKQNVVIAECKGKARRNYYPDTGINTRNLREYLFIQSKYHITVFVYFADEMLRKIYGNRLSVLMERHIVYWKGADIVYPKEDKGITYFPLEKMVSVANLTDIQVKNLIDMSTRKHEYVQPC